MVNCSPSVAVISVDLSAVFLSGDKYIPWRLPRRLLSRSDLHGFWRPYVLLDPVDPHRGEVDPEMFLVIVFYPLLETLISEQIALCLWIEYVVCGRMRAWEYGP